MLKFFFNRFSKVVYTMEILGVLFTVGWLAQTQSISIPFAIYLGEYLFLRFCTTVRWHKGAKRYEGIELQFKKAMIPASYLMAITSGIGFWMGSTLLLWVAIPLLAILAHVNWILIYLYCRDKNTTPINYFSNNKFLTRHVNLGA